MELFSETPQQDTPQAGFDFPMSLTEKYAPTEVDHFVGLDKVKKIARGLIASPRSINLIFSGPSGVGKSNMARVIARKIPAEMHLIPSQECNLATIERIHQQCHYVPHNPQDLREAYKFHLVLADEIDLLTAGAQNSLLSKTDGTNNFPNTVFIGTTNLTPAEMKEKLLPRFVSRFQVIEFPSYGIASEVSAMLETIWRKETSADAPAPNFARIVKDSSNNVREALMRLDTELLCAA